MVRMDVDICGAVPTSVTTRQVVPLTYTVQGFAEEIALTGNLNLLFRVTVDANGESRVKMLIRPLGVGATGLTSGILYHVLVTPASDFDADRPPPFEFIMAFSLRLMGQGPENGLLLYETLRIAVNADRTVTAVLEDAFSVASRSSK